MLSTTQLNLPTQSAGLSIFLLGNPRVVLDGNPIEARFQSKVLALLAYLAVARRALSREHLLEIFWPDVEPESARANLRVALYRLRQMLGDERYLTATRDAVALDGGNCWVDALVFLDNPTVAQGELLEQRLALYRGEFLDALEIEGCPDFADWLEAYREECRRNALGLADKLSSQFQERGDYSRALAPIARLLELEPWNEAWHRKAMTLLALDGQRGAALAQYEICRKALARELGVAPQAATRELFEQIESGQLAPPAGRAKAFSANSATLDQPYQALIVDDHLLFRAGLNLMLNEISPATTVHESPSCEDALALAAPEEGFDIILLDLKFPGMSGLDALVQFRERYPASPVVLFSSDRDEELVIASRQRGARGYLSKSMEAEEIISAIETVLAGGEAFPGKR